jgi:hypothetical protein
MVNAILLLLAGPSMYNKQVAEADGFHAEPNPASDMSALCAQTAQAMNL